MAELGFKLGEDGVAKGLGGNAGAVRNEEYRSVGHDETLPAWAPWCCGDGVDCPLLRRLQSSESDTNSTCAALTAPKTLLVRLLAWPLPVPQKRCITVAHRF